MFKTLYEEASAAFKVYGTIPAGKSSFKLQGENTEEPKESHGNGQLEKRTNETI